MCPHVRLHVCPQIYYHIRFFLSNLTNCWQSFSYCFLHVYCRNIVFDNPSSDILGFIEQGDGCTLVTPTVDRGQDLPRFGQARASPVRACWSLDLATLGWKSLTISRPMVPILRLSYEARYVHCIIKFRNRNKIISSYYYTNRMLFYFQHVVSDV